MSRDVLVKFYVGDECEKEICFNILKNVLDSGYIVEMTDYAIPCVDPFAGYHYFRDYFGLLPKYVQLPEDAVEESYTTDEGALRVYLERGVEECYEVNLYEPSMEEALTHKIDYEKYMEVFHYAKEEYRGNWYNTHSIELVLEKFKSAYTEKMRRVFRLESIADSEKFYTLNEDQRYELKDDIAALKEEITDIEWSMRACTSLIDYAETLSFSGSVSMFVYLV